MPPSEVRSGQDGHEFDKDYWERHWQQVGSGASGSMDGNPPNPHLIRETSGLEPGTALDAGCGAGAESIWLALQGWRVTGADISADALARAARRAAEAEVSDRVSWVEADLTVWEPDRLFELVTTNYAHPDLPQLAFYERIAGWVAPGGTLLIVGHRHGHGHEGHEHGHGDDAEGPPAEATVTVAEIVARLDQATWAVETAEEHVRTLERPGGRTASLNDVVVRATRRG